MALHFFKQRDIDEMDPYDIPEEFINYFDSLSEERKAEIIVCRPDLAEGLAYIAPNSDSGTIKEGNEGGDSFSLNSNKQIEDKDKEEKLDSDEHLKSEISAEDIFAQISNNLYEDADLDVVLIDGLNPVEALTLPDKVEKCPLHRTKLEKINIKYRDKMGRVYGIMPGLCRKCKRLFLEESQTEHIHNALMERNINHTFYDLDLTNLYLRSQQSVYVLKADEKIYVPDIWVEENPKCPIHGEALDEITCERVFAERKVSFIGYLCEHCNKILIRKAVAVDLVDKCAMAGVPEIEYEMLVKKTPVKNTVNFKEIRPDYFIQDGKRIAYNYNHTADCYKLTEEDIIVVSDSVYCNFEGHDTEEVLALIMVKEKLGARKAYLFMVGYCAQCQKYYMDEEDYKVVYSIGRPEVTILSDIDSDAYYITSGEVFNLERKHLDGLECRIKDEISNIHHQKDYINPYAVGDYDDGNLSYAKSISQRKYGSRLEKLVGYQPKPYSYRVDITCDGEAETYYVGPSDIELDGKRFVISFNSEFGYELVNYQTIKISKDGKEYDIKLSRQFDIEHATLYGYANLRTDEDIIFRSGITDPFLVRVLNMRKKQHNLIDIIATIQENQNTIVDVDFDKNIIIQGCAGSGKTMVLLHRLSSLQYRNKYFDFSDQALILTPNDQFSLHIKGLAEGLQLGNIERISVEQYYVEILCRYSEDFKLDTKLSSEMFVPQDYVDFIYSDQFKEMFDKAYNTIISERNALVEILDNLIEVLGQPKRNIDLSDDTRVIQQIRYSVEAMNSLIRQQEIDLSKAKDFLKNVQNRKDFLEKRIPEVEQFAAKIVQESLPRVYAKISEFLHEKQEVISQLEARLNGLNEEKDKVQRTIIMFGKKARLEKLDESIKEIEKKLNFEKKKTEENISVFSMFQEGKSDAEILEWMEQVRLYIKDVEEEIRLCRNGKQEAESLRIELENDIPEKILAAQEALNKISAIIYPSDATETIQYLNEKLDTYTTVGTFQMIFEKAVEKFKEEQNIKEIKGKYHRYDLYARLIFAMKYFKSCQGRTRFMCIDEGQDLALNEYRLLFELNSCNITFNIFGDTNQLMKPGRGISDWSVLKNAFNASEYTLNENYRNTNQITRFCNSSFGMEILQTGVDGAQVREIARRELEDELASLSITTERVAILVPRGVQKMKYLNLDIIPSNVRNIIGDNMDNGYISVMYVDEVKGIEFDKVYVVGNKMTRNEKYIAYTRALSELILVVDDAVADYDDGSEKKKGKSAVENKKERKQYFGTLTYKNNTISEDVNLVIQSEREFAKENMEIERSKDVEKKRSKILKTFSCAYRAKRNKCVHKDCKRFGEKCTREGCEFYLALDTPMTRDERIALKQKIQKWEVLMRSDEKEDIVSKPIYNPIIDVAIPFEGIRKISMNLIKLPGYFRNVIPNPDKTQKIMDYYQKYGKLDKPIKVLIQDDKYLLKDKYLRYYVAKELHFETIEAEFVDKKKNTNEVNEDRISISLQNIAGSALKEGEFIEGKFSDEEIRDAITNVFSVSSKKDTSYKFVFLKSIIDCMYDVQKGFRLSFDQLFHRFTEIYWPMVVGYNLHQKVGEDSHSYVEQILIDAVANYGVDVNSKFIDLTKNQQRDIVKAVKQKCKMNVVGAIYGDTKGIFYSFSRKEEWIEINPLVFHFLIKYGNDIQEMNYKAWAEFMERVNTTNEEEKIRKQHNVFTGTGSKLYRQILKSTFMIGVPVIALCEPVINMLLKVG